MPGIKGDEFLINTHKKFPKIVKIMLTGQADEEAVNRASLQLVEMERLSELGQVPQSELKWAKMELQSVETDARLAELDLSLIQLKLQDKSE